MEGDINNWVTDNLTNRDTWVVMRKKDRDKLEEITKRGTMGDDKRERNGDKSKDRGLDLSEAFLCLWLF